MKTFLRMTNDQQTTVLTLPAIDFGSLQEQNLLKLQTLFRRATGRVTGKALILDVSAVRSAGAAFLTIVNEFASGLGTNQIAFTIVGDVDGLIRLVGWRRRFQCYPSLLEALLALPERRQRLSTSTSV